MVYRIAMGTDTKSLEDPYQIVILDLPDEVADLDSDSLVAYIDENGLDDDSRYPGTIPTTAMIPFRDTMESLRLAMAAEGVSKEAADNIVATVTDALVNNFFDFA